MKKNPYGNQLPFLRHEALTNKESWSILCIVLLIYNFIKYSFIQYSLSDENVYFYMGKLLSEGILPYRDFFFAHPPLKLIPPAIIFSLIGFNFTALKLLPVIAADIICIFLFLIVKNAFGNFCAIFTASVFLFSFSGLYYTSYFMGTNLTTAIVVIALYLYQKEKYFISGILLGLALLTGLYSACAVIAMGVYLLIINRQLFKRFIMGILIIFIPANILCISLFRENYYIPVYLFHLLKSEDITNPRHKILFDMAKLNIFTLGPAAFYPFFKDKRLNIIFWIALSYLVFLIGFSSIHDYYFILITPFLAILGTHALLSLIEKFRLSYSAFSILCFIIFVPYTIGNIEKFRSSILMSSIPQAHEIAQKIKENIPPSDGIFGQAEITPLLALISGTHIHDNLVDTNPKLYIAGVAKLNNVMDSIKEGKLRLIITREKQIGPNTSIYYGPAVDIEFREFLWNSCKPIFIYSSSSDPDDKLIVFKSNW